MSYAVMPSARRAFHGMGMGAYDPVAKPVFDGCTMNLTIGRTTWPSQWACNQSNFLAALEANKAMMPANATQSATNLHFMDYFKDVIAGKISGPAGFPSTKAGSAPDIKTIVPSSAPAPVPAPSSTDKPSEGPRLLQSAMPPLTATPKYVYIGAGVLAVVGLLLAVRK